MNNRGKKKKERNVSPEMNLLNLTCYFGVSGIKKVASMVREGMPVEEACEKEGIVGNERSTLYLLFARECYASELYDLGDAYMRKVERMKDKSGFVVDMMNLVHKNRLFFPNRVEEGQKRLCLRKTR